MPRRHDMINQYFNVPAANKCVYNPTSQLCLMFSQQRNKEDCQKNCQETSGCNFWTFVSRRERSGLARSCFLYSSKTTQVQSRRRTSGPKFCSSQPPATSRPPVSSMGSNSPLPRSPFFNSYARNIK